MGIGTKIILIVILLHLIAGFGYMVYLFLPKKGDQQPEKKEEGAER